MDKDSKKIYGVYIPSVLDQKVLLSITEIGKNIKQNLENAISERSEGKCIKEGFIKPGSIRVIKYSNGVVNNEYVEFQTTFECMICNPVENMDIDCKVKTITKAGIHAEVIDDKGVIPVTIFVARDHHLKDTTFSSVTENDNIRTSVIGVRYELNDPYIVVIARLIKINTKKITIQDD